MRAFGGDARKLAAWPDWDAPASKLSACRLPNSCADLVACLDDHTEGYLAQNSSTKSSSNPFVRLRNIHTRSET